jgi:hypothetical protein
MSHSRSSEETMADFFFKSANENEWANLYESPKKVRHAPTLASIGNIASPFVFAPPAGSAAPAAPRAASKFSYPAPGPKAPSTTPNGSDSYPASYSLVDDAFEAFTAYLSQIQPLSTSLPSALFVGMDGIGDTYRISPSTVNVDLKAKLGNGASAIVYKAKYENKDVAVKVMKFNLEVTKNSSEKEIKILAFLMSKVAPYMVKFFGYYHDKDVNPTQCVLVLEHMNQGSLQDWIENPKTKLFAAQTDRRVAMRHLSEGLEAIHKLNYVISDIKSANILIKIVDDAEPEVKLADFCLAVPVALIPQMDGDQGTPHYMAPEVLENYTKNERSSKNSQPADVYGLCIVFLEFMKKDRIANHYALDLKIKSLALLVKWLKEGNRPELPSDKDICPPKLRKLLQRGFFAESYRPKAGELANTLREVESDDTLAAFKKTDEYKQLRK